MKFLSNNQIRRKPQFGSCGKLIKKGVTEATPKRILLSCQKPNIAAGGIFSTLHSNLAILRVGSERPEI